MNSRTESLIGQASDNDFRIALHYEDAAKILYKSDAYQDHIVLPTLFLVRQFLELALKSNIRLLNEISSCSNLIGRLNKVHDLNKIHEAFLEHYKSVKKIQDMKDKSDKKNLEALAKLIEKISLHDSGSQGYRYSENITGTKIISANESYNLEDVFKLLEDTSDFFAFIKKHLLLAIKTESLTKPFSHSHITHSHLSSMGIYTPI